MIQQLFDISYVMVKRTDLSFLGRIKLVITFSFFSLKTKLITPKEYVFFLGKKFFFRSFSNLHTILKEVFFYGEYRNLISVKDPKYIIDCGGNIGVSVMFLKYKHPRAKVVVFEPSEENIKIMKQDFEANNIHDVEIVHAAASIGDGFMSFWENDNNPGSSTTMASVADAKGMSRFVEKKVRSVKLSSYIHGAVDLLKMDIEGGEGLVLKELDESGKLGNIREIIFEYHANQQNKTNTFSQIVDILEKNNFSITPFGIDLARSEQEMALMRNLHFMIRAVNLRDVA